MSSIFADGQVPELKTTIDTAHIRIGEQVSISFEVKHLSQVEVYWPNFKNTFGMFELVDGGTIASRKTGNTVIESRGVIITSFDSGYHALEPFVFTYRLPGAGTVNEFKSEAFMIRVSTVEVDTSQPIKPIVGPYSEKRTLAELLPYIVIPAMIVALVLALWLLWRSRSRRKAMTKTSIIPPDVSPHEWALSKLNALAQKRLWQHDHVKQHYVELTDILRMYIEKQLNVSAIEQTSWEIIQRLKGRVIDEELDKLQHLLEIADLVKFAKEKPLPDEHQRCLQIAYDFVSSTAKGEREREGEGGQTSIVNSQ